MIVYLDRDGNEWHVLNEAGEVMLPAGCVRLTPEEVQARRLAALPQ